MATVPKTMPARGHATAPKFISSQPRELPRYFNELNNLFQDANITDEGIKKAQACRYVDIDESELWQVLPEYTNNSYDEWKKAVLTLYPGAMEDRKWSMADLDHPVIGYFPAVYLARRRGVEKIVAESTDRLIRHPAFRSKGSKNLQARKADLENLRDVAAEMELITFLDPEATPAEVERHRSYRGQRQKQNFGGRPIRKKHRREKTAAPSDRNAERKLFDPSNFRSPKSSAFHDSSMAESGCAVLKSSGGGSIRENPIDARGFKFRETPITDVPIFKEHGYVRTLRNPDGTPQLDAAGKPIISVAE